MSKSQVPQSAFNLAPAQAAAGPALTLLYLFPQPLIAKACQKGGIIERSLLPFILSTFRTLRLGEVTKGRFPTAVLLASLFSTYCLTATISIGAQASHKDGYVNKVPRERRRQLTGFPLRVTSAHDALMEFQAGFVAAAVLAQILAPNSFNNELALIFVTKSILYPLSYYFEPLDILRSSTHITAVATALRVLYKLAFA